MFLPKTFVRPQKWIRNICSKGKTFLRYFSLDIGWNPDDWIFSIFIPSGKQNLAEVTNRFHVQSYSLNCQECQHGDASIFPILTIDHNWRQFSQSRQLLLLVLQLKRQSWRPLRHWLQFWQLRTWIHDNLCYLTINWHWTAFASLAMFVILDL